MRIPDRIGGWLASGLGIKGETPPGGGPDSPAGVFNFWNHLGVLVLFLFANQVVTGVLLAFYYEPSSDLAVQSLVHVSEEVPLGWLVRNMHRWGSHLLIALALIHLLRVHLHGAFRAPRELNCLVGFVLLFLALAFAVSGAALPWDRNAYQAVSSVMRTVSEIPLFGGLLLSLVGAEDELSEITLTRFFTFHTMILPWLFSMAAALHVTVALRHGFATPAWKSPPSAGTMASSSLSGAVFDSMSLLYILAGALVTLAVLFPLPAGQPAGATAGAPAVLPPWWFRPAQGLFLLLDPPFFSIATVLCFTLIIFHPFSARLSGGLLARRKVLVLIAVAAAICAAALSAAAIMSARPDVQSPAAETEQKK